MNQRLKDRIESDRIITVIDTNGKDIIRDGELTLYGKKLEEERKEKQEK